MPFTISNAEVSRASYVAGEEFTLRLTFLSSGPELASVSNVSVDLFRAERERNQLAIGFGASPKVVENVLTVTRAVGPEMKPGIHLVGAVTLCWSDHTQQRVVFSPVFFEVRAPSEGAIDRQTLTAHVAQLSEERRAHAGREIRTPSAVDGTATRAFRVLVCGVGCLLHAVQQLEGFAIHPLGRGLSYGRLLEIANMGLKRSGIRQINFDPQAELQHEQATPTFLIEYWRVTAVDQVDALDYCRAHADLMFDLLALDRGQKPREFFCLAADYDSNERWHHFSVPWYRGNLVSDFNPVATANLIETVTPRLQHDPFLRLLVRSCAEATAEQDAGIALLRAWTVLELLADRAIPTGQAILHPDGSAILNQKGNPKDTNAKEARVYEMIRRVGAFTAHYSAPIDGVQQTFLLGGDQTSPQFTPGTRIIPLWDVVRAAYAIRNNVAHEGYFSPDQIDASEPDQVLAADLIENTSVDPRQWILDQAHAAVSREFNRP